VAQSLNLSEREWVCKTGLITVVPLGPRKPRRCFAMPLNPNQRACHIDVLFEGTFVAWAPLVWPFSAMPEAWLNAAFVAAQRAKLPLSEAARVARFSWAAAGGDAADFAIAPVVACREPLSTVGLGNAISATGLASDFATRRRVGSTITRCGREGKGKGRVRHEFARAIPTPCARPGQGGRTPACHLHPAPKALSRPAPLLCHFCFLLIPSYPFYVSYFTCLFRMPGWRTQRFCPFPRCRSTQRTQRRGRCTRS
jgi:hypothetical protein